MARPNGRPPKFKSATELHDAIVKYFQYCKAERELPNKAGLCVSLIISRDTYSEYRKKFPDTIKDADATIENAWVQRLAGNSPTGAIFYLKNAFSADYRDRTETDLTSAGEKITGFQMIPPNDRPNKTDQ